MHCVSNSHSVSNLHFVRFIKLASNDFSDFRWKKVRGVDVLCRQQIELFQVVSTSEFLEYWWNDLDFIFFVPPTCCRASEASKIDYFKNKVWTFWTKNFNSSLKNGYFGDIIFQEIEFFEHLKCNFKTLWPPKISISWNIMSPKYLFNEELKFLVQNVNTLFLK